MNAMEEVKVEVEESKATEELRVEAESLGKRSVLIGQREGRWLESRSEESR